MSSTLKQFRARALKRPALRKAYDELEEEFAFLDEVLRTAAITGSERGEDKIHLQPQAGEDS